MRAVIGLMIKDAVVLRKYGLFMLVYLLVFPVFFKDIVAVSGMAVGIVVLTVVSVAFAFDDVGRGAQLIASLPVKRAFVPLARYLEAFICLIAGSALFVGVALLFALIPGLPVYVPPMALSMPVMSIIGTLVPVLLLSVMMPIWYRFGYAKTRIMNLVLFGIVFASGSVTGKIAGSLAAAEAMRIIDIVNGPVVKFGGITLTVAVFAASCLISMRIYERKEF